MNKIVLQDEDIHYKIEPSQGKISGGESQDFKIFFFPEHAHPYYEFCDFIVEDLPLQSMRYPPDGLKQFVESNTTETKIPMPTYLGSNTQYLSIPFLQFNLRGQGNFREMTLDPPILEYKEELFIHKEYTKTIRMSKKGDSTDGASSAADTSYKKSIHVVSTDNSFEVSVDTSNFDRSLASDQNIDIDVTILSRTTGLKTAYLMIEFEDGVPLSYFIQGEFKGPEVSIVESNVEFGLQKINSSSSFTMNITNYSSIDAPVFVKNAQDSRNLSFGECIEEHRKELIQDASKDKKKAKGYTSIGQMSTHLGNKITFEPQYLVIPPNSRGEITVTLKSESEEEISEILELLVKDSESQFIKLNANIQKLKVCLNRYQVDLGKIYAGIKQSIGMHHDQCIVLKNYGNIPAKFQWNEKVIPDELKVSFDPARGTIAPHAEFVVNIRLTAYLGGQLKDIFTCDITDLDFPLGFTLTADVFGLRVAHTLPDYIVEAQQAASSFMATGSKSKILASTTHKSIVEKGEAEEGEDDDESIDPRYELKTLRFPSCTINKPSSQKFILKNLSGIKTTFNLKAITYEPDDLVLPANIQGKSSIDELPKQDMDETITISKPGSKSSKRETKIRFALTNKTKKGLKVKQLKRALLTDSHEHQNKFSSKTGETFTATKRLEREQAFYLSNDKGLAIVFSPNYGELRPHSEIPINVTIYNSACGKFEDTLISEIKGLPKFKFPINVTISGSPLIIPENQVGLNYVTTPPTMAFPTVVDNSPQISKSFKIKNTGIADVVVDWSMFDERDQKREEDQDLFNITIQKNTGFDSEDNPFKLNFDFIEPEPSKGSPFEIDPKVVVIPARETQFFEVKFNSNQGVGVFKSVVLSHPQLASDIQNEEHEEENKVEETIAPPKFVDPYDYQSDSSDEAYQNHHNDDIQEYEVGSQGHHHQDGDHQTEGTVDETQEAAKRSLGIVALNLFAKTIEPVLTVDMKRKLDGEHYFNFYQWPMDHEDEPSPIQKICLVNETKANIIFNVSTQGPFNIVGTKTNSGSVHPLAPQRPSSKGIKAKPETMFSLQPNKIVQMKIEFLPPDPLNYNEWPLVKS